jgi:hypothetical protein
MKPSINLRSQELVDLKSEINSREETLASLKKNTFESMAKWLAEAALQGQALERVRVALGHGLWLSWVATHCPFAHDTASRYMAAAANFALERNLNPELTQLDIARKLVIERQAKKEPKCVVAPDLRLLSWAEKFSFGESQLPLEKWDKGTVQRAKDVLEPVVQKLWPGRI